MNHASFSTRDLIDVGMILLPLAAGLLGLWGGLLIAKESYSLGFRDHVERHATMTDPDLNCIFCREERGVILAQQMANPHQALTIGKTVIPCSCPDCRSPRGATPKEWEQ